MTDFLVIVVTNLGNGEYEVITDIVQFLSPRQCVSWAETLQYALNTASRGAISHTVQCMWPGFEA